MKTYVCKKCGSIDLFIDERDSQNALLCGDCGAWIKWVGKKEMPLVKRFLESNSEEKTTSLRSFEEEIYFNRESEDNWDIIDKAKELKFKNYRNLKWLGNEVGLKVRIDEELNCKVLEFNGKNVEDLDLYI